MPSEITGDYSKYPESIRNIFPYVTGEVCELRSSYTVYKQLFMQERSFTEKMSGYLGPLLGVFQNNLEDQLFLSVSRLTDRDSRSNKNLSLWSLNIAAQQSDDEEFVSTVAGKLDRIKTAVAAIRRHRSRRIGHFDLKTSLAQATLPVVTFTHINTAITLIEEYLNLFYQKYEDTTMLYDTLSGYDIYGKAYDTVVKAITYDELEKEGTVRQNEYKRRLIEKRKA